MKKKCSLNNNTKIYNLFVNEDKIKKAPKVNIIICGKSKQIIILILLLMTFYLIDEFFIEKENNNDIILNIDSSPSTLNRTYYCQNIILIKINYWLVIKVKIVSFF